MACSLVVLFLAVSCVKDKGNLPKDPEPTPSTPTATDPCDTITYEKHIRPIVTKICLSCHGDTKPSSGYSLNSYNQLKEKGSTGKLEARVVKGTGGFMPQGRAMSTDTIKLFSCWIKNGYKQ